MRRTTPRRLGAALMGLALLGGTGCATNPATGKRQLALISEQEEIAMGRQADEEIGASLGLYGDPGVQAYVADLGKELAATSERPDLPWSFEVVDDPIVNAFALPGGFIYVTRGIMAHLGSEAELAAVLGHEIGHVTGRHSVSRISKAQLLSIGLGVGMVLSPELARFSDLAETGLGLLFLKFSRDDESQADDLGLRYMVRGGFDPRRMPDVFEVLRSVSEAGGAGRVPGWMSTHPDPENRRDRIASRVNAMETSFEDSRVAEREYLQRLDGMVFGENPREGYFEGSLFLHPDLRFRLEFPPGWETRNQRQSVVAVSPQKNAAVQLTLVPEADPREAAGKFLDQEGVSDNGVRTGRINGLPAAWGDFTASSQPTDLRGRVMAIRYGEATFQLLAFTLVDQWAAYAEAFTASMRSFRELTDPAALGVQPARIEMVRIDRSMTLEEFARRYPPSVPTETIALINQVPAGGTLPAGSLVKRVVGGRPQG